MTLSKFTNQPANEEIVTTINDIIDAMGSTTGANIDLSNLSSTGESKFQTPLISGTNIKTINNTSLLGSGNISLAEDDTTISKNSDDELQTIGVIDDNAQNAYNFTVVGSPTITADGIASGFSSNSFIQASINVSNKPFIFETPKFVYSQVASNRQYLFTYGSYNTNLFMQAFITNTGVLNTNMRNNSTDIFYKSYQLTLNNSYQIKYVLNNTEASIYLKTNDNGYELWYTTTNTSLYTVNNTNMSIGQEYNGSTRFYLGSIDLKQFKITVDGVEVYKAWQPQALKYWTGTKTEYDAISSYDTTTLYNVEGVGLYKGTTLISNDGVSKSGDTMTGDLTINKDNANYIIKSSFDSTTTTAPSAFINLGTLAMYDTNDNFTGYVQNSFNTDNIVGLSIGARRIINGVNKSAALSLKVDDSGNASCSFPDTDRCDGQYVSSYQSIATSVNLYNANGSDTGWYTVNIPNDGYHYMVWISCRTITGSTTGDYGYSIVKSDLETYGIVGSAARTRANSSVASQGTICIPVGTNRRVKFARNSAYTATANFYMHGYRRIGKNS